MNKILERLEDISAELEALGDVMCALGCAFTEENGSRPTDRVLYGTFSGLSDHLRRIEKDLDQIIKDEGAEWKAAERVCSLCYAQFAKGSETENRGEDHGEEI